MEYNVRIDDNFLRGDHVDGEVLQHTDLNELENVAKTAINANYEDIQKLQDGTILIGNSEKLDGASLSKFADETLQNSDTKVPTSSQVKQYVDGAISNIDLDGYYTKREIDAIVETYDSDGNGIVDNSEKVNNHTVLTDVPENAVFTDTVYDDTEVRASIANLNTTKQNIIFNDYVNVTSANAVNLNTAPAGLYHFKNSYIIWGDLDEPQLYKDSLWLVEVYSETNRTLIDITYQYMYIVEKSGSTYSMEEVWFVDNVYFEETVEDLVSFTDYPGGNVLDGLTSGVIKVDPACNMAISDINYPGGRGVLIPNVGNSFLSNTQLLKSGNGAPTLGSYEILGSFYQDEDNGNLYQLLLDTDGDHHIWKQIATKSYVDGLVGNIQTLLDALDNGAGV